MVNSFHGVSRGVGLEGMGFALYEVASNDFRWQLGIDQSVGLLEIGAPCDGLVLFVLFAIFHFGFPWACQEKIVVYPGWDCCDSRCQSVAGLSLVILNFYRPEGLAFNHDYTWTVLIYGFIFWLWYCGLSG